VYQPPTNTPPANLGERAEAQNASLAP